MGIVLSDEGNGFTSCVFTGTIVIQAERKQAISRRSGKYSEFAELEIQFRQKDFPADASCYMVLRVYSQKNADLMLRLRRGTQVFGLATISTSRVIQWKNDGSKMFGNTGVIFPITPIIDFIMESMDRKKYVEELAKYKPDPNAIDWSGGGESYTHDVTF